MDTRAGRWGISRIVPEVGGGFTTAALEQRLGPVVVCHYPPHLPTPSDGFVLPYAMIRCPLGITEAPTADTRLFPDIPLMTTLGDLSVAQRLIIRTQLEEWLSAYTFTDFDGTIKNVAVFSGSAFTLATPLRDVILDVFRHFSHSATRQRPSASERHNTEYLDDFATDPASRWTTVGWPFVHDSGNGEMDVNMSDDGGIRYSDNGTGSIEHESQVTNLTGVSRIPGPAVRFATNGDTTFYALGVSATDSFSIQRLLLGARTTLASATATLATNDFATLRFAAEGGNGATVAFTGWLTNHGVSKPADPGWIAATALSFDVATDSSVDRLDDDSLHMQCGVGGRLIGTDYDTQTDYFKQRTIADRSGGPPPEVLTINRNRTLRPAIFKPGLAR